MITIPNSSGFSTEHSASVASAPRLLVEVHDRSQIDVGEHVARNDHEALVELLAGVEDRSGGPERRFLGGVHHPDAQLGPIAEVATDGVGHERDRHDDVGHPVLAQEEHHVLHHRAVGHRQHGLGLVGGEWPQSGALTPGHDDGLHRLTSDPLLSDTPCSPRVGDRALDAGGEPTGIIARCRPIRPSVNARRAGPT